MHRFLVLALLGGCSLYFGGPDDYPTSEPQPEPQPQPEPLGPDAAVARPPGGTCTPEVSLALAGQMSASVPVTLGTTGTTLCVRLDTIARTHPTYFEARTLTEPGEVSSFGLTLFAADNQLLGESYDAPLPSMETYATVGYYVQVNAVFYVKVHVYTRDNTPATELQLSLYQVLD